MFVGFDDEVPLPSFSQDFLATSAYVPTHTVGATNRIFLPLTYVNSDQVLSWSTLAEEVGVPLSSETVLTDLLEKSGIEVEHPQANAPLVWVTTFLSSIAEAAKPEVPVIFAAWPGYAGDGALGQEIHVSESRIGPWRTADLSFTRGPLSLLEEASRCHDRFPVYVWSLDLKMVLSCPLYSDSLFLTSSVTLDHLSSHGIEAVGMSRNVPLPTTGD